MGEVRSGRLRERIPRWFGVVATVVITLLALFYLFVVPALVASGTIPISAWSTAFAAFLFAQFWMLTAQFTYSSASQIYGFRRRELFTFAVPQAMRRQQAEIGALGPVFYCIVSYALTIYGFGIGYAFVSHSDAQAFNAGPLTLFDSLYFSLITAATIGYGDISPVSRVARAFVMAEVLVTFFYAIVLLSMLGGALRDRRESRPDSAQSPATPTGIAEDGSLRTRTDCGNDAD